jgi:hypothetical protein
MTEFKLELRPGFDWRLVAWGRPDSPVSGLCSYCRTGIGPDDVPLIMWNDEGYAAQLDIPPIWCLLRVRDKA